MTGEVNPPGGNLTFVHSQLVIRRPGREYWETLAVPCRDWQQLRKMIQSADGGAPSFKDYALASCSIGIGIATAIPSLARTQGTGWSSPYTIGYIAATAIFLAVSLVSFLAHRRLSAHRRVSIADALGYMDNVEALYGEELA